jgi:hypothetical protein
MSQVDGAVTSVLKEEIVAIESISIAFYSLNRGYTQLDDTAYGDPTIGVLLNMLHRNYEHAEAAVVAFVTGSGASAEVIARAALETSVNIMYILIGDRVKRLRAYFEHYFRETNRQVTHWETRTKDLPLPDRKINGDAILRRRNTTDSLQKLAETFLGSPNKAWPNTSQRFEAIGPWPRL